MKPPLSIFFQFCLERLLLRCVVWCCGWYSQVMDQQYLCSHSITDFLQCFLSLLDFWLFSRSDNFRTFHVIPWQALFLKALDLLLKKFLPHLSFLLFYLNIFHYFHYFQDFPFLFLMFIIEGVLNFLLSVLGYYFVVQYCFFSFFVIHWCCFERICWLKFGQLRLSIFRCPHLED